MENKGKFENKALQENIEKQVKRLLQQLSDIELLTTEAGMDQAEIEYFINKWKVCSDIKKTTKEELKEFQEFVIKSKEGNMSLIDSLTQAQIKIQEAILKAFNTKEIKEMYSSRQGEYYRVQLEWLRSQFFTQKIDKDTYIKETFDNLNQLSEIDKAFL